MLYLAIGVAGFLGAVARYGISELSSPRAETIFPWTTLFVNISGSFLLGLLYSLASEKLAIDPQWRAVIAIGFLGSYTTFSTFSFETFDLVSSGSWFYAGSNIFLNVSAGLLAIYLGTVVGRLVSA